MITWTKRLLLTCTILGLLATNVLTLTSVEGVTVALMFPSLTPSAYNADLVKLL